MLGDVCGAKRSRALHHTSAMLVLSFIQPFAELATEHLRLNSPWRDLDSLLAPAIIVKRLHFAPSPFPVKQTHTRTLSCPVDFTGPSRAPVDSTVVFDTTSFHKGVSSIARVSESANECCFCNRRTCIK